MKYKLIIIYQLIIIIIKRSNLILKVSLKLKNLVFIEFLFSKIIY